MLRSVFTKGRLSVIAFAIFWILVRWQLAQAQPTAQADPACQLPQVEFLGEGQGVYTKPAGFDQLIVKKFHPFRFELSAAAAYTSTKPADPPERVWACAGNCTLPAVFHYSVDLGYQDAGSVFRFVIIDDDVDQRRNTLLAGSPITPTYTYTINQQGMVQTLVYTTPHAAPWWLYAEDSIGLVQPCVNSPDATPTSTPDRPGDPEPPMATATASPTETATEPPTATLTAEPGDTPSATPSVTPEPSQTPTASPTPTPTATATNTPIVIVLTPTATVLPTNLDPQPEPGKNSVFLPIVVK